MSNSPYFFSEPLSCKNPFNNIPFNKSTLYNIYFRILEFNKIVPILFHLFFLSNFDINKFKEDNECYIRDYAILDYVKTKDKNILFEEIINMLYNSCVNFKIRIDNDFPKNKLVSIMRPYLLLYFKSKYSLGIEKQRKCRQELNIKLYKFYKYSPMFGRKKINLIEIYSPIRKKMIKKKVVYFIDKHIPFNSKVDHNFIQTHYLSSNIIENHQEYQVISDDDTEDDETEEDTEDDETEEDTEEDETEEELILEENEPNNLMQVVVEERGEDEEKGGEEENFILINGIFPSNIITYHTDVDSQYFNEIFEHIYEERKDDDSIS